MNLLRKIYYTLQSVASHPLKRGHKWRAMREFCVAQLAVRLIPGDVCVAFPNQTRLLVSPRMKGSAHFISPGLCEFDDMSFVTHFLRADDLFADVGANVGAYTVLASGVSGARTVCFEPSPSTFQYLEQNVRINDLASKVRMFNAAVGRSPGRLRLTQNLGTENHICQQTGRDGGVEVEVTTLDTVLAATPPALMKMDVEGFETEALGGAEALLSRPGLEAMIIERGGMASRYGYDETSLHQRIRAMGFIPCSYSALERRLFEISPEKEGNIIYVRDFNRVRQRVQSSPTFRFAGKDI